MLNIIYRAKGLTGTLVSAIMLTAGINAIAYERENELPLDTTRQLLAACQASPNMHKTVLLELNILTSIMEYAYAGKLEKAHLHEMCTKIKMANETRNGKLVLDAFVIGWFDISKELSNNKTAMALTAKKLGVPENMAILYATAVAKNIEIAYNPVRQIHYIETEKNRSIYFIPTNRLYPVVPCTVCN